MYLHLIDNNFLISCQTLFSTKSLHMLTIFRQLQLKDNDKQVRNIATFLKYFFVCVLFLYKVKYSFTLTQVRASQQTTEDLFL